jgi:putative glutamine amidotransferase
VLRPRIGITGYWTPASWGYWHDVPACLVPGGYVEGVRLAGGTPLLVPPDPSLALDPAPVLDVLDGLLLVGGEDLDPALYGAEPHPKTTLPSERRDAVETTLLREALERDLPTLGICRGCQLLNVAHGGTLEQHLADHGDLALHRPAPGVFGRHPVEAHGGRLGELLPGGATVHSAHHQGLGAIGEGLVVTGRASDGEVEAVEAPGRTFVVGVLWHPEEDPTGDGAPLFRALVDAARDRAAVR